MSVYLNIITEKPLGISEFTFPPEDNGVLFSLSLKLYETENKITALNGLYLYGTDELWGGIAHSAEDFFARKISTDWAKLKFSELFEPTKNSAAPYFRDLYFAIEDYHSLYENIVFVHFLLTFICQTLPNVQRLGLWWSFDEDNMTDEPFNKNVKFLPEVKLDDLCADDILLIGTDQIRFFTL